MDFYYAMFDALGSPAWHGASIDSLIDSMVWGGINMRKPPYNVEIKGIENASPIVRDEIKNFVSAFEKSKEEYRERNGEDLAINVGFA